MILIKKLQRCASVVCFCFLFTASAFAQNGRMLTDRIAAWVDDRAITLSDVEEALARYEADGDLPPKTDRENLRAALDRLVEDELLLAAAKKMSVEVPPEFLDNRTTAAMQSLEKSRGGTEKFDAFLKKSGRTRDSLRDQIREQFRRDWIISRAINSRFAVSNEDVENFIKERKDAGQPVSRYALGHLFLPVKAAAPDTEWNAARTRLALARTELLATKNFVDAAAKYAAQYRKDGMDGGYLGLLESSEIQPELAAALEKLEPGQCSEPVRTARGLHLIYLERKTNPRDILFAKRFEEERVKWLEELRKTARVEILEFK
jgi:peptidyl-prolyl cis-trans isomerase SurA